MKKIIKDKYSIINNETGEIVNIDDILNKKSKHVKKQFVEHMIDNASNSDEIDLDVLYSYLRSNGELNEYHQIKLKQMWCKDELFDIVNDDELIFAGYFFNLFQYLNKWTNVVYLRDKSRASKNWTELYEVAGIRANGHKTKFKQFCQKHDLIRQVKVVTDKGTRLEKMTMNPFKFRGREYTGLFAIVGFNDLCQSDVNMSKIMYVYLRLNDWI